MRRQQGIYVNGVRMHANTTDVDQRIALRIIEASGGTAKVTVYSRGKLTVEFDVVQGKVATVSAPANYFTPIAQKD